MRREEGDDPVIEGLHEALGHEAPLYIANSNGSETPIFLDPCMKSCATDKRSNGRWDFASSH